VIKDQVDARAGDQDGQPLEELDRVEHQVRRPVGPRVPEPQHHLPRRREDKAILRAQRPAPPAPSSSPAPRRSSRRPTRATIVARAPSPASAGGRFNIQFPLSGNRQDVTPGRRISDELGLAAVLGDDTKPETAEDTGDLVAGEPTKLWHTTAGPRSSRTPSDTLAGRSQRDLRHQGGAQPRLRG
jgi:hypothetical protein